MNQSITRRRFLGGMGLVAGGVALQACAPAALPPATPTDPDVAPKVTPVPDVTTVRITTIDGIVDNAIWMVGEEQGFFADLDVELTPLFVSASGIALNAVLADEADFADSGISPTLAAQEAGAGLKLLGGSRAGLDSVVYSQQEVESLHDLEGRSVGTGAIGSFFHILMMTLLREEGVDVDQIDFVNIGADPDIYRAVVAGTVDAGLATVAFRPSAEEQGIKILAETWTALPNYLRGGFFATDEAIAERGEEIARALAGFALSYRYLQDPESRDLYVRLAVENLGAEAAQAEALWDFKSTNDILALNLELRPETVEYMQQLNVDAGSQERILPFEEVVDTSLRERALELVGEV